MFSAKMVCLIQKLFGRDENSATNAPNLLSRSEMDSSTAADTHRPQQSVQSVDSLCAQLNCPNRQSTADMASSESKNTSPLSHHRSRSVSIPSYRGITKIDGSTTRLAFADQDASSARKPPSTRSSSFSWSLPSSSEDQLSCCRPVSEPVCCCEACTYILESTLPFTAHHDKSQYSPPPGYDRVTGCTQSVLTLSGFAPTAASHPCNSSLTSCSISESSLTSSANVRPYNHEKTPHQTNQQHQPSVVNLTPMISISPDGEEGFANSQRILQRSRRYKPFCEVPPNKTICHVHWKSMDSE